MVNGTDEQLGEGLREQRLAGAGGTDEQDVRLLQLDVGAIARLLGEVDALVVIVDRHRELLLRHLLADDVLVEQRLDLLRLGQRGVLLLLEHAVFGDDVEADVDALVADEDRRTGDQLLDLALALVAETAPQSVVAGFFLRHRSSVLPRVRLRACRGGMLTRRDATPKPPGVGAPYNRTRSTLYSEPTADPTPGPGGAQRNSPRPR